MSYWRLLSSHFYFALSRSVPWYILFRLFVRSRVVSMVFGLAIVFEASISLFLVIVLLKNLQRVHFAHIFHCDPNLQEE